MLSDRGSKKWVSLMLPEHVEALKKLYAEQEHKEKPILDEQQLLENDFMLHRALHHDQIVEIKYFENHDFQTVQGKVLFIKLLNRCLHIENMEIKLDNIIEVNIL